MVLLLISLFSDFLANEKPIYCEIKGESHFPIFKEYAVSLGWQKKEAQFATQDWANYEYESVLRAPIPYSSDTQNILDKFVSPFGKQRAKSLRWRHWLGTDHFGRDVAAGMISGTRTAMLVGFLSMLIATIIGIIFGAFAGYFGDSKLKISRASIGLNILAIPFAIFFGFIARKFQLQTGLAEGGFLSAFVVSLIWFVLPFVLVYFIKKPLEKIPFLKKQVAFPVDSMVMRLIEIFRSVPGLLLLIAIVAVIPKPSILNVILIIGLIRWTSIAAYLRGEMLRIRELEYIQAAKALGFSNLRIIFKHALPNALTPVLISITFGVASAILLEAFLSFLGIGLAVGEVTWGSLLNVARDNFSAWWLAVFPGFAIFISVTILNLIGDGLSEAMEESE